MEGPRWDSMAKGKGVAAVGGVVGHLLFLGKSSGALPSRYSNIKPTMTDQQGWNHWSQFTQKTNPTAMELVLTWASLSLHSCLAGPGNRDCAGGQWKLSARPFTEHSGVRPSVISKAKETKNSSASYSKYSSKASGIKKKGKFFIVLRIPLLIHHLN